MLLPCTYWGPVSVSSSATVYARTVDNAGNVGGANSIGVNIDTAAPSAPSISKNPYTAWANGNVSVTITGGTDSGGSGVARTEYSTDGSGVARTEYSTDGWNWGTYGGALTISSTQTVYARTVDHAGNYSSATSAAVNIDKTAPGQPTLSKSPNTAWHNGDVTVTVRAGSDSGGSGIQKTEYRYNNSNWTTYTAPLNISSTKTIYTRTWDVAGNVSGTASVAGEHRPREAHRAYL